MLGHDPPTSESLQTLNTLTGRRGKEEAKEGVVSEGGVDENEGGVNESEGGVDEPEAEGVAVSTEGMAMEEGGDEPVGVVESLEDVGVVTCEGEESERTEAHDDGNQNL